VCTDGCNRGDCVPSFAPALAAHAGAVVDKEDCVKAVKKGVWGLVGGGAAG
jgi:hypothetical protein